MRNYDDARLEAAQRGHTMEESWESILSAWQVVTMVVVAALAALAAFGAWNAAGGDASRWRGLASLISPPTWPVHAASFLAVTGLLFTNQKWRRRVATLDPPFVLTAWFESSLDRVETRRGGSEGQPALQNAVHTIRSQMAASASWVRIGLGVTATLVPALAMAWTLAVMGTDQGAGRPLIDIAAPLIVAIVEGVVVIALVALEDRRARIMLDRWEDRIFAELKSKKRASPATRREPGPGPGFRRTDETWNQDSTRESYDTTFATRPTDRQGWTPPGSGFDDMDPAPQPARDVRSDDVARSQSATASSARPGAEPAHGPGRTPDSNIDKDDWD